MRYFILTSLLFFINFGHAFSQGISWNVHGIFTASHKKERAIKINKLLVERHTDVVLIQEAFSKSVIKRLSAGYKYRILPKKKFLKLNSGLLVLSNSPITDIQYLEFKHRRGIDRMCNKGAVKFTVDGIVYINTHLQNHYPIITEQQISELFVFATHTDLIAGDFNYSDCEYLSVVFGKNILKTDPTFENQTIDYVLTNKKIRSQVLQMDSLSDHRPIYFFLGR